MRRLPVVATLTVVAVLTAGGAALAAKGGFTGAVSATVSVRTATLPPATGLTGSSRCTTSGSKKKPTVTVTVSLAWTPSASSLASAQDVLLSSTGGRSWKTLASGLAPSAATYSTTALSSGTYSVKVVTASSVGWTATSPPFALTTC